MESSFLVIGRLTNALLFHRKTLCVRIGSLIVRCSFQDENNSRMVYLSKQTQHPEEIVERKDEWSSRTALESEQYVAHQSLVEQCNRFNVWLIPARINKSPIEYHNFEFIFYSDFVHWIFCSSFAGIIYVMALCFSVFLKYERPKMIFTGA